jgi:putative methyltransferase
MKRNVYLVDLGTASNRNLMPLGVGLISAYAASRPAVAEAFDIDIHFLRGDNAEIVKSFDNPKVIGFACYTWNFRASMRLAAMCREAFPEAIIVAGGYSVPKRPERIAAFYDANPWIDVLVHGEGEFTFAGLLEAVARGDDLASVKGITFRRADAPGGFLTTERRERIADLNDLPSPFLNGTFDKIMAKYGSRVTGVVWETNRGCPFACTFCDWGNADVNKVKQFAIDRLDAEIEWIARNKIFYIYLADANFGIFYDRDLDIAGRLAARAKARGFPGFMAINWTKNSHERIIDIADKLKEGGISTSVTLAVQSFNTGTLDAIKRRNIKHDSLLKLKKAYHDRDLPTYTEMILGLPGESYETFVAGLNQASTARLADHWVFHLCTLLENTAMESKEHREKYGIVTRKVEAAIARRGYGERDEVSEIEELVVGTAAMPVPEWRKAYMVGYLSAALYNFRSAFFPMRWLKQELGIDYTDFVEWLIEDVEMRPAEYPRLAKGVGHVRQQQRLLLDSIASLSPVAELGGNLALPHEGALAVLLGDSEELYRDLRKALRRFADENSLQVTDALIDDIVRYQQARMPTWPLPKETRVVFRHNVADYFDAIASGREPPALERQEQAIEVAVAPTKADNAFAFAGQRTRSGHTIKIYDVAIVGRDQSAERSAPAGETQRAIA